MAKALRIYAAAGAVLILAAAAAPASAQGVTMGDQGIGFSPFKPQEKRRLTPDEIEKQQKLDDAYKAATNKIPDQKANDPWGIVRPSGPAPAAKKKTQTQAQ
jgi:Spy/CpxP family protein refolding chaperone